MNAFVSYLAQKHGLSMERAEKRAAWILEQQAKRRTEQKAKLERAQLTLGLDADGPGEEPISKYEQDPTIPF